jgi:hypothetical protein
MKRNAHWFWPIVIGTVLAFVGGIVYLVAVGVDKANVLSGPAIALGTVILVSLTALLLIKPEAKDEVPELVASTVPAQVKQRASEGGRNYLAGRDVIIGGEPNKDRDDPKH